jgi:hypothetical protein
MLAALNVTVWQEFAVSITGLSSAVLVVLLGHMLFGWGREHFTQQRRSVKCQLPTLPPDQLKEVEHLWK